MNFLELIDTFYEGIRYLVKVIIGEYLLFAKKPILPNEECECKYKETYNLHHKFCLSRTQMETLFHKEIKFSPTMPKSTIMPTLQRLFYNPYHLRFYICIIKVFKPYIKAFQSPRYSILTFLQPDFSKNAFRLPVIFLTTMPLVILGTTSELIRIMWSFCSI